MDKDSFIGKKIGSYTIISKIACGSYGCVYKGQHNILTNRLVAIKLMNSTHLSNEEEYESFFQEAKLLELLKHPHILPIIDVNLFEGFPYLILEYASKGSLRDRLKNMAHHPLPLEEAINILSQIGRALNFAHNQNIIHRDLKPENILFNAKDEVILADFGIAALLSTAKSVQIGFGGTPTYMAPEQFEGIISKKSDQYALGCIAYELLTGSKPFNIPNPTLEALWYHHAKIDPIAPTKLNSQISSSIEQAILKAMAKQRDHRYSDIASFIEALRKSPKQWTWVLSDTSLLNKPHEVKMQMRTNDIDSLAKIIQDTLRSFRVEAEVRLEDISIGPTVIRFGIRPTGKPAMKQDDKGRLVPIRDGAGNIVYEQRTRVSRIMALQNDLALVLEAKSIRMIAPVPGHPYVGVEIPNKNSRLVTLREVLESNEYASTQAKSKLAIPLGKDVAGAVRVGDLARMPHLLVTGATGSGKSVFLNTIISSFLMYTTPDDMRMLMIDPKMVELNMYNGIPHLLSPVITEVEKVADQLKIAIAEMEKRYRLFSQLNVRNLVGYHKLRLERMARGDITLKNLPTIVIIINELADLMMATPEEVEGQICRLAQLARATGIHLIIATQRSSVDVITDLIKANIPTRISFMVSSAVNSRTIIDMGGAERLLGRGDMLYLPADAGRPERIQGAFIADDELNRLVSYWKQQVVEHAESQIKSTL